MQLSWSPRAYHLKGLLSDEECEHIKKIVSQQKLCSTEFAERGTESKRQRQTVARQQQFPCTHWVCAVTQYRHWHWHSKPPTGQQAIGDATCTWTAATHWSTAHAPGLPSAAFAFLCVAVCSRSASRLLLLPSPHTAHAHTTLPTPQNSPRISSQPVMWSIT